MKNYSIINLHPIKWSINYKIIKKEKTEKKRNEYKPQINK